MATEVIADFPGQYRRHLLHGQRAKLGLRRGEPEDDRPDAKLAEDWLTLLHTEQVDFTLGWRRLADAASGDDAPLRALFADARAPDAWLARWRVRCASEDGRAGDLVLKLPILKPSAEVPVVVTDTPVVHSLVSQVMGDLGEPTVIVEQGVMRAGISDLLSLHSKTSQADPPSNIAILRDALIPMQISLSTPGRNARETIHRSSLVSKPDLSGTEDKSKP